MFPDLFARIQQAGRAAWAAWNGQALIPTQQAGWDLWASRLFRYELYGNYYSNNIYSFSDRFSPIHKSAYELYKNIRPIENPVNRLIELYVSKVYGGNINMQTLESGALPFTMDSDLVREAIRQGIKWSNWNTQKSLFVRHGALYGDVGLKVVDDRVDRTVRLEVLDPRKIKHATFNQIGDVDEIHIEYYDVEESDTRTPGGNPARNMYLYTEIITPDTYSTFKNGVPFAYYEDDSGTKVSEWPNEYGFVPVTMTQHRNIGLSYGMNAFQASLRKIDEINDVVSLLDDAIRKHVNVLWYFAGVAKSADLDASTTSRDQFPAVYGPKESNPVAMVANLDIAAVTAHINELVLEIERDMPELSLHRLREKGLATAPGVRASYSDAIDRIVEARGNYNAGLIKSLKQLIRIGGYNRYDGFESFSLASEPDFTIADRPVIEDELPKAEKITALISSKAPNEAVWQELGYSQDVIDKWSATMAQQQVINVMAQQPGQPAQLGAGQQPPAQIQGNKLPTDQATSTAHLTPDHLANLFDQYHSTKAAAK